MSETLAKAMVRSPKNKKTEAQDQVNNCNDKVVHTKPVSELSFGELLQLTPQQEQQILNDLLNCDIPEQPKQNNVQVNNTNPVNAQNIVPRMLFNNSNITINFNIMKN